MLLGARVLSLIFKYALVTSNDGFSLNAPVQGRDSMLFRDK